MNDVKFTKLQNGMTVITDFNPSIESVTCCVWVNVGSRCETPEINGVSHFLEHMAFKGTETKTYTNIAETIEDIGGDMNAYTSKDHTLYYTKTLKEHISTSIDILSDIIQNSIFDETETDKERQVILQEYYSSIDTPDDIIDEYYNETAYKDQALGRMILGSDKTIKSITQNTLKNYIKKNYSADKIYLIVSGNFSYDNVIKLANKYFTNINPVNTNISYENAKYTGGYSIHEKDLEQIHFILGFESNSIKNRYELLCEGILNNTLGGGMSSRLFQEIREKQNLVYSIYSSSSNYSDTGNLYIYTSTEPNKINKVIDATTNEIKKICENGITEKEFLRAKAGYKSSILMSLENSMIRARSLGKQMQHFGKYIPLSETINLLDSIKINDIQKTAQKIFSSKITAAALGKCSDIYDLNKIDSLLK